MEIMRPEDRVVLWRATVDAAGSTRESLLHAVAQDVFLSLRALDLYDDKYKPLVLETLQTLDDAGLFASDSLRICLEAVHDPKGGADLLAGELAGLLRMAADVVHLGAERRVRAVTLASRWREHVLARPRPEQALVSVGDVAARFGVTTQAVYKWLRDGRVEATRGPGGSWRIPSAQFDSERPATTRRDLDALQAQLIALHTEDRLPANDELGATMRDAHAS